MGDSAGEERGGGERLVDPGIVEDWSFLPEGWYVDEWGLFGAGLK